MSYVILITNPSNGHVMALAENNDAQNLKTFRTHEDAETEAAFNDLCCAMPYAVVEAP